MIKYISLLRNVGVFYNTTSQCELKRVVLIYAENASGKTTLAEVIRSLENGDPSVIVKRHKLGAKKKPFVVLKCDKPAKVMFQDGSWGSKRPLVRVFDEAFITDNVYSGLDIKLEHRKNLHALTLGTHGVALSQKRESLVQTINQHNKDMKEARDAVESKLGGLSMDEFCNLEELPDIDAKIKDVQTKLNAARDGNILETDMFEKIDLPVFDEPAISAILQQSLQNLSVEAANSVTRHIKSLGDGGESWVANGVGYMSGNAGACPFCGQVTADALLITHYRAYFSEAYEDLKRGVRDILKDVRRSHSPNTQTTFERTVGKNRDVGHFWAKYGLQMPDIDTKQIVDDWMSATDEVVRLLEEKQAAPLERMPWDGNMLEQYEHHIRQIKKINSRLDKNNEEISKIKKRARLDDLQSVRDQLSKLFIIKERYSPETAAWCNKYVWAKTGKDNAVRKKDQATQQLKEYREKIFPALQEDVNRHLSSFGVRYEMFDLKPTDTGIRSSCNYSVRIDSTPISTNPKQTSDPTIGSTLSTSDRNTLALALFFASLEKDEDLSDTVVVVDDPVSSFDDNRSLATAQKLRELARKSSQMIVLSHNSEFLLKIRKKIDQKECSLLTIVHSDEGSAICGWDPRQEYNAEQAKRQSLLETYNKDKTGDPLEVAKAIRPYLENVLEVVCAGHYDGSKQIGSFIVECSEKCGTVDEILNRATVDHLRNIVEYASPFMHGAHKNSDNHRINSDELRTFVKMTLDITKLSVLGPH